MRPLRSRLIRAFCRHRVLSCNFASGMKPLHQRFLAFALLSILSFSTVPASLWHHHDHTDTTEAHTCGDDLQLTATHETPDCLLCDFYVAPYVAESGTPVALLTHSTTTVLLPDLSCVRSHVIRTGPPRAPPIG